MYNFIKQVTEGRLGKTLERVKLAYSMDSFGKSLSEKAIEYHYGKLYKSYCDRYNSGEGDPDFNEAGAFLHAIYFNQLCPPEESTKPNGPILDFIENNFGTYNIFKELFEKEAMKIQGSGWAYLAKDGKIKIIKNHQIKKDIVILIDWWEHAWALDYQADKKSYLNNQWKIIDWNIINARLN